MSPDGKRVAVDVFDPVSREWISDIWLLDLSTSAKTRFTFNKAADYTPVWSPDGSRVVFASDRSGTLDLYAKSSTGSGTEELLLASPQGEEADAWSPDGRFIVYSSVDSQTRYDIWILPLFGDRKPIPYLRTEFSEGQSQVSPNGRWLAYTSNESGNMEVYVRSFPVPDDKWQASSTGGADPRWRRDGKELFYIAADGTLTAVAVETGAVFKAGAVRPLFETSVKDLWEDARNHYEVSPDGERFLVVTPQENFGSLPFTVIVNWTSTVPR
jgi:eukaryotic-like serine/threonine-protein kinase